MGLGRAGLAAAARLSAIAGPDRVRVWSRTVPVWARAGVADLRAAGVEVVEDPEAALRAAACVVKSPGVAMDAPVVARALASGLPVLDELELGWRTTGSPLVGVTGSNGKSTVCRLLSAIAEAAGRSAPVAGNTEFGPPLSSLEGDPGLIVCEVSSYQLEGSPELLPEAAVLTHLREDHLLRHGDMQTYAECKRRLFVRGARCTPLAVLNGDDALGARLAREVAERGGRALRYGRGKECEYRLLRCGWTLRSGTLEADTPRGRVALETRLPGPHNAENALAAYAMACELGLGEGAAREALASTSGVPGRFETVVADAPFDVVVDFAHTADAVARVIETARAVARERPGARVHALVSVAGWRAPALSGPMGEAAARLADRTVLSAASTMGADRDAMLAPLLAGARSVPGADIELIADRRLAIRTLLAGASPGDVVLVTGRGARSRLQLTPLGEGVDFDDRVVAREELARLAQGATARTSA